MEEKNAYGQLIAIMCQNFRSNYGYEDRSENKVPLENTSKAEVNVKVSMAICRNGRVAHGLCGCSVTQISGICSTGRENAHIDPCVHESTSLRVVISRKKKKKWVLVIKWG